MAFIRDLSIKQKLRVITMLTVVVSLLVAGVGIVISDSYLFLLGMQRDLAALATIVSDNSTASLEFDDPRVARDTLEALKARPHMVAACIYKNDGSLFARYVRTDSEECDRPAEQQGVRITLRGLIASNPILLSNERVGTLLMRYDLGEAVQRVQLDSEIVLLILLVSSVVAFLLSSRLQRIIASPISSLAGAAASVSRTGDYSVRVEKTSGDELGVLVDAFNEMLARVQSRDSEVQNARYSLQTILTSIGDAVISTDTKGNVVFTNPAAQALLGKSEETLIGQHIDDAIQIVNEISHERLETPVHRVLRDGMIVAPSDRAVLINDAGNEIPIDDSAAPIRDANGKMTGVVLILRDISNRRATEKLLETQAEELRQRAQLLKETDQRKDEFLAMLAHELRNPLAPIRNAVEILKRIGPSNAQQAWASEVIERQAKHLTHLVDDLLDVSRITRGKVTLKQETLDLTAVIAAAVEMSRPLIDARRHHLTVSLPEEPVYLSGDLTRLAQVIGNLLNNAAKFTDQGGVIRIDASRQDSEAVIRVSDNGIGMAPTLLPHVFDLFAQADRSLDRSQGGLGIGLTLARTLVEMHGGRLEAKSEGTGRGSEFIVRLPAVDAPTSNAASSGTQIREGERLRVLVCEDNKDSAEMLAFMLRLDGHEVTITLNGEKALEAAQASPPNVIICDIGLPGMNGYDVASRLRARPEFARTLLIALSGYGQEEDRSRSREAGFDHHLTKPVEPKALSALLRSTDTAEPTRIATAPKTQSRTRFT